MTAVPITQWKGTRAEFNAITEGVTGRQYIVENPDQTITRYVFGTTGYVAEGYDWVEDEAALATFERPALCVRVLGAFWVSDGTLSHAPTEGNAARRVVDGTGRLWAQNFEVVRPEYFGMSVDAADNSAALAVALAAVAGTGQKLEGVGDYRVASQILDPDLGELNIDLSLISAHNPGTGSILNRAAVLLGRTASHAERSAVTAVGTNYVDVANAAIFDGIKDCRLVDPSVTFGTDNTHITDWLRIIDITGDRVTFNRPMTFPHTTNSLLFAYPESRTVKGRIKVRPADPANTNQVGVFANYLLDADVNLDIAGFNGHAFRYDHCYRCLFTGMAKDAKQVGAGYGSGARGCSGIVSRIQGSGLRHLASDGSDTAAFDGDVALRVCSFDNDFGSLTDHDSHGSIPDTHDGSVRARFGDIVGAIADDANVTQDGSTNQGTHITRGLLDVANCPSNGDLFQPNNSLDGVARLDGGHIRLKGRDGNTGTGITCLPASGLNADVYYTANGADVKNFDQCLGGIPDGGNIHYIFNGDVDMRAVVEGAVEFTSTAGGRVFVTINGNFKARNDAAQSGNPCIYLNGTEWADANGGEPGVVFIVRGNADVFNENTEASARDFRLKNALFIVEGDLVNQATMRVNDEAGGFLNVLDKTYTAVA